MCTTTGIFVSLLFLSGVIYYFYIFFKKRLTKAAVQERARERERELIQKVQHNFKVFIFSCFEAAIYIEWAWLLDVRLKKRWREGRLGFSERDYWIAKNFLLNPMKFLILANKNIPSSCWLKTFQLTTFLL